LVGGLFVGLRGLRLVGDVLGPGEQRVPFVVAGLADLAAQAVLLGAQTVVAGHGGAAGIVGGEKRVDKGLVRAPLALRSTDEIRIVAEQLQVDHVARLLTARAAAVGAAIASARGNAPRHGGSARRVPSRSTDREPRSFDSEFDPRQRVVSSGRRPSHVSRGGYGTRRAVQGAGTQLRGR